MAVFTAIASAIVTALGFGTSFALTFKAALAFSGAIGIGTSLLAAGLAVATAKASGLFSPPGATKQRPRC